MDISIHWTYLYTIPWSASRLILQLSSWVLPYEDPTWGIRQSTLRHGSMVWGEVWFKNAKKQKVFRNTTNINYTGTGPSWNIHTPKSFHRISPPKPQLVRKIHQQGILLCGTGGISTRTGIKAASHCLFPVEDIWSGVTFRRRYEGDHHFVDPSDLKMNLLGARSVFT